MFARILGGRLATVRVWIGIDNSHLDADILGGSRLTQIPCRVFRCRIRAWRGEQPLWKVFWGYGVVTSGALIAFYVIGFYVDRIALRQVLVFCFAFYTVWILVSVWRCANNTRESLLGLLALVMLTVAWACNTILVLVFVQINLIMKYLQHLRRMRLLITMQQTRSELRH